MNISFNDLQFQDLQSVRSIFSQLNGTFQETLQEFPELGNLTTLNVTNLNLTRFYSNASSLISQLFCGRAENAFIPSGSGSEFDPGDARQQLVNQEPDEDHVYIYDNTTSKTACYIAVYVCSSRQ